MAGSEVRGVVRPGGGDRRLRTGALPMQAGEPSYVDSGTVRKICTGDVWKFLPPHSRLRKVEKLNVNRRGL